MNEELAFLNELTSLPGVSGFEEPVARFIENRMRLYCEVFSDNLGSVICKKSGSSGSPKIMLAGHMDEVGFVVTYITKEGFLKFQTLGGWWEQVMLGQRVTVKTSYGDLPGITGSKPPHILKPEERNKVVKKEDMFIDIGASDREEAERMGVRPGDPVVLESTFTVMGNPNLLMAKAWDDRIGCAVFMKAIEKLSCLEHPNTVYGVGTVQEELGLRGAVTGTNAVAPDIGFALDIDIAGDTPGVEKHLSQSCLGKGPSILVYDRSMIPHRKLRDFVLATAKKANIPVQFNAMPGGASDAGKIHLYGRGVPSLVVGVPCRYIHSNSGIIHKEDYENTVKLMVQVIMDLNEDVFRQIKER